jgi:hypothetical protein
MFVFLYLRIFFKEHVWTSQYSFHKFLKFCKLIIYVGMSAFSISGLIARRYLTTVSRS